MESQRHEVLQYMREHGSITRMESFIQLGITELSSRIGEIERIDNICIDREPITVKARNGRAVKVMKYSIAKELEEN